MNVLLVITTSAGMAHKSDESDCEPQAPKKLRRVGAQSQEEWVFVPNVVKN